MVDKHVLYKKFIKMYTYDDLKLLFSAFNITIYGVKALYTAAYNYLNSLHDMSITGYNRSCNNAYLLKYKLFSKTIRYEDLPNYLYLSELSNGGILVRWRLKIGK